ncbi:hypothetical protein LOD99_6673 [Oopsacas minuta]|uniref:Uncharacterized protein n=1 Tax=Oopsacas minuta TaxID=111878 RepID=A0AAV7JMC0_9METZ|nr:hypothetical protein LOD99_6673 [Oopsacas minuta]
MASVEVKRKFIEQVKESRSKIRDCFKKSHEALQLREGILLSRIDEIEKEYNIKNEEMQELLEALNKSKSLITDTLTSNKLKATHRGIESLLNKQIEELSADTDSSFEFEWNSHFEADIEQLGSIMLNGQTNKPPTHTFPPQVKPVVPDYKAKHLPTAYCCKKSTDKKAPGELHGSRGIAIHYLTGNIYIADCDNNRVQVFSSNGDYLFMFSEEMNLPYGIGITQNKVFVTQFYGYCINKYELEGKLIKSVGSQGNGEAQFNNPCGLDVSDRSSNVYVCDIRNNRVQILTQELKFHSMLGIDLFKAPLDIKVTRDRVLVLDRSDPCMLVFNSYHVQINRLITCGDGKQTNNPDFFDIDRDYNIIMSDCYDHCVYVFNQEGEQIHKFGEKGHGIGEFYFPYGIVLDNTGHIIVVCQKNTNCLQFF